MKRKVPVFYIGIFLLFTLFFISRFFNIMQLPIFTDEAIYVRWAQIARFDSNWRFISLTDGKQPSFIWVAMSFMRIIDDPLLASRTASVFAAFGTLIGVMLISWELFKKRISEGGIIKQMFGHLREPGPIGFLAGLLYIFFPFALVYDRMALYESTLTCAIMWSIYMTILLVRYIRLDLGLLFGVAAGSAMLTKTSGFFSIYMLPFAFTIFNWKQKYVKKKVFELIFYMVVGIIVSYAIYSVLRLSTFFYIIDEKNGLFVWTFSEWLHNNQFEILVSNLKALPGWLFDYVSIPVALLAATSFFVKKQRSEKVFIFLWFLLPFAALCIFGKTIYPRFIYFMTIPLIILASYSLTFLLTSVKVKYYFYVTLIFVLLVFARVDYYVLFNFPNAPIPKADLDQFSNSWPAGGGIKEMITFFTSEAEKGKIYVATEGTFGSLPTYSMEIYLGRNENIEMRGIYPLPEFIPPDLQEKASMMPVYLVTNDSETPPISWPLTLISKYQKGIGDRHLSIYKVNP